MITKRHFFPGTLLLLAALLTLSLLGCQKDSLTPQDQTTVDQSLTFLGGSACENGVMLLQMAYQANEVYTDENRFVELLNNGSREEFQDLNDLSSDNLLEFTATGGTITWGSNFIGITSPNAGPNWINDSEALYIKLGTSAAIAGWKMIAAGIWVNLEPGSTVRVQLRKNGAAVQNPVTRSNNGVSDLRVHIPLSLFYQFDEIEVSAAAGRVQLRNNPLSGTTWNRFVITDNSNDFIAARQRAGLYFWNSIIDNDHAGLYKPNHQYLSPTTGNFEPTPMNPFPNEWMSDAAVPAFINRHKAGGAFGPANPLSPGKDYGVHNGESMVFKIGSDVGSGATFTNVVVPIFRPAATASAAVPRIILRKGGMDIASFSISQQLGTLQYHLIGVSGSDFDEIEFTTTSAANPSRYYEISTDYWSVLRFSLCQSGGGGEMIRSTMEEAANEAPYDLEEE